MSRGPEVQKVQMPGNLGMGHRKTMGDSISKTESEMCNLPKMQLCQYRVTQDSSKRHTAASSSSDVAAVTCTVRVDCGCCHLYCKS